MKNQTGLLTNFGLVLATLGLATTVAGQQISPRPESSVVGIHQGQLRPIRVLIPENGSATIEGAATRDAVSYQSGDRFVVIVPQAFVGSFQNDVSGPDFLSVKV